MQSSYKLAIKDMHCGACVRRVTAAIQSVKGVTADSVEVGSAAIRIDLVNASVEQVISALDLAGFHAAAAH